MTDSKGATGSVALALGMASTSSGTESGSGPLGALAGSAQHGMGGGVSKRLTSSNNRQVRKELSLQCRGLHAGQWHIWHSVFPFRFSFRYNWDPVVGFGSHP